MSVEGLLATFVPLEGLMPISGDNGFSLQHPLAIGELDNLYSMPEIGYAMTNEFFTFGSELSAEVGGDSFKYLSLTGMGINPVWLNPSVGNHSTLNVNDGDNSKSWQSTESAMWVRIDPADEV